MICVRDLYLLHVFFLYIIHIIVLHEKNTKLATFTS